LVVLVSGVWLVTDRAEAESYTWDGSYNLLQYWDEPTNWSPQGVPSVKGDTVTFDSPGLFPPSFSVYVNETYTVSRITNRGAQYPVLRGTGSLSLMGSSTDARVDILDGGFGCDLATVLHGNVEFKIAEAGLNADFDGEISGSGNLIKMGPGSQTLAAANSYTGDTLVQEGVLINQGTIVGDTYVSGSGMVEGTGEFALLAFDDGGTFSPGEAGGIRGFAQSAAGVWGDGGTYRWDINDADGTAGFHWDLWKLDGSLESEVGAQLAVDGNAAGFNNTQEYSWLIAETTAPGDLANFEVGDVTVDSSGFGPDTGEGQFWLAIEGNALYLEFGTPEVPSPSAAVGLLGMIGVGVALPRRRRRPARR
jgi:MYXO-CTERM domain-containing protein